VKRAGEKGENEDEAEKGRKREREGEMDGGETSAFHDVCTARRR